MMRAIAVFAISFLAMANFQLRDHAAAAEQNGPDVSTCAPKRGEGAHWLVSCENAASAGDGRAAFIVGSIYWNGDGVPKDNDAAAH